MKHEFVFEVQFRVQCAHVGSLQLSRWEQEGGPPNPKAPELIGAAMAKLAEPI